MLSFSSFIVCLNFIFFTQANYSLFHLLHILHFANKVYSWPLPWCLKIQDLNTEFCYLVSHLYYSVKDKKFLPFPSFTFFFTLHYWSRTPLNPFVTHLQALTVDEWVSRYVSKHRWLTGWIDSPESCVKRRVPIIHVCCTYRSFYY